MEKEELLRQAVEAHEAYVRGVEQLRRERQQAFLAVNRTAVTNRELAKKVGLSEGQVGKIVRGTR